jgi:superfamily I DNA/RNA helicase
MVVFPHIVYDQYKASGLHWMIPMERALLKDDMEPTGEILCDPTGTTFSERIADSFPFPFKGLTPKEIDKLSFVIWNESQIKLPLRKGSGKTRFLEEVQALDDAQGRLALRLKPGHMIIKGPPGSGKTLVLVHRCCHLYRLNPQVKRVLLVCFNIALVSYLKRLIQEKGLGVGDGGVCVCHFYELCSRILKEPIHYENEESDYYDVVMQQALAAATGGGCGMESFDAVFIDEGQDFSKDMLKTVLSLLKPGGDLVIALDSYQDLYSRRTSWKRLGIKAAGRTRHLKTVYRNTREIFDFTRRFIGETGKLEKQITLLPDVSIFHGGLPEVLLFQDQQEIEDFLIKDLRECLDNGDYSKSEVAIIYDDKVYGLDRFAYDNRALPMRVLMKLEGAGISTTWVSQDVRSKQMYDVTTERVSLISIHSSKGLDFGLAYLLGVDRFRPADATRAKLTKLIYVAMTRAKYRLVIPYMEETEFVKRMLGSLPK